jgi:V/A-type H+-transporting ATPase subunit D
MELTRLKKRLKTAVRGHKLLKDKNDELVRTFISFIRRNKELREQVEASLAAAMGSAAIAKAKMGEESMTEALMYPVSEAHAQVSTKNIMSVIVPQISFRPDGKEADLPYGFAFTPSELDTAVLDVAALLPQLIELAGVEKTCDMLADEIEKTKRRVNALEHVSIPEMQEGIRAITMKLEENERANTTRLMKVKTMIADRN